MSDEDYVDLIELRLNPCAFEFLKRCLLMVSTNPLTFSEDQRLASELYDKLKEQYDE